MNGILLQRLTKIRLPLLRAFIFCGLNNICTSCSQTLKFVCTFMTEINVKKRWHVRFHEFAHGLQHFSIVMQDSTKLKKVPLCKMTLCTITEDRHSFGSPRFSCSCFNDIVNYLLVQWLASRHYVRPSPQGPLFVFQDGSYLTRDKLVVHVQQGLRLMGVDPTCFSGHSFRIGAAIRRGPGRC